MLFPIKRILVCTDLSEHSDEVLRSSEIIRQRVDGELDILYVSDLGLQLEWFSDKARNDTFYKSFIGNIADEVMEKMKLQMARTSAQGNTLFKQGHVVQKISDTILEGEKKYDLLIIGHNSKAGLLHHFIGSVARKLLSSVSVPTLVIRKPIIFFKIAGLIDERGSTNWMITSTMDFYRTLGFENVEFIALWHKQPAPSGEEESKFQFEDDLKEDIEYFTREGEKVIVRVEDAHDFQMAPQLAQIVDEDKVSVAVMKRNRGKKLNKLLLGSETMRMLEMDTANLMVMPV
ncbi:MAG: universal stress protein [Bacteriovoracaceae bacterium]|nr:universal stress protein [Bacteriovoracaceae bacterium]